MTAINKLNTFGFGLMIMSSIVVGLAIITSIIYAEVYLSWIFFSIGAITFFIGMYIVGTIEKEG